MRLPDYTPETETVEAPWAVAGFSSGQVFPPVAKAPDGRVVVDIWADGDKTMARVWRRADHRNLKALPGNAPRKVRAIYRADGQLAMMRAADYWSHPVKHALEAWEGYLNELRHT